jgi:hypothetical protein
MITNFAWLSAEAANIQTRARSRFVALKSRGNGLRIEGISSLDAWARCLGPSTLP